MFGPVQAAVRLERQVEDIMKLLKQLLGFVVVFAAGLLVGRLTLGRSAADAAPRTPLSPRLLDGVPDVRQSTGYSCGASALQAVLAYWGTSEREDRLMARLHTTPEQGTSPDDIVRVAREFNLRAELKEGLEMADLEAALEEGQTVIVDLQAWRESADAPWSQTWDDGHYVVLLGADAANLYFEDPSLLGARGSIPKREFLDRWHDYEGDPPLDAGDRKFVHAAIFIRGDRSPSPSAVERIE
jgi:predicted double-glycine peptidase